MNVPNIEFLLQRVFEICKDAETLTAFFQAYYNWSVKTKKNECVIKCPKSMKILQAWHENTNEQNKNLVMILPKDATYAKTDLSYNAMGFANNSSLPGAGLNDFNPSILFFSKKFLENAHIVGDIHADFAGLCGIVFEALRADKNIVFLGDYVDRGAYSTETLVLALLLHTVCPERVVLMRGNHETHQMSLDKDRNKEDKAFIHELCERCGDDDVEKIATETAYIFGQMPVAALNYNRKIFLAHAGPPMQYSIQKPIDFLSILNLIQYLWSDPYNEDNYVKSPRGLGFLYGQNTIPYDYDCVIRAHQYFLNKNKAMNGKICTVFSTGDPSDHSDYKCDCCIDPYIAQVNDKNEIKLTSVNTKDAIILGALIAFRISLMRKHGISCTVNSEKYVLSKKYNSGTNIEDIKNNKDNLAKKIVEFKESINKKLKQFNYDELAITNMHMIISGGGEKGSLLKMKISGIPETVLSQLTPQEYEKFNLQDFLEKHENENCNESPTPNVY